MSNALNSVFFFFLFFYQKLPFRVTQIIFSNQMPDSAEVLRCSSNPDANIWFLKCFHWWWKRAHEAWIIPRINKNPRVSDQVFQLSIKDCWPTACWPFTCAFLPPQLSSQHYSVIIPFWSASSRTHLVWGIYWGNKMSPKSSPPTPTSSLSLSHASVSLTGEHMGEDEKESDEIELNVGGDSGAGRRMKKRRERTEQERQIFTSSAHFSFGNQFLKWEKRNR